MLFRSVATKQEDTPVADSPSAAASSSGDNTGVQGAPTPAFSVPDSTAGPSNPVAPAAPGGDKGPPVDVSSDEEPLSGLAQPPTDRPRGSLKGVRVQQGLKKRLESGEILFKDIRCDKNTKFLRFRHIGALPPGETQHEFLVCPEDQPPFDPRHLPVIELCYGADPSELTAGEIFRQLVGANPKQGNPTPAGRSAKAKAAERAKSAGPLSRPKSTGPPRRQQQKGKSQGKRARSLGRGDNPDTEARAAARFGLEPNDWNRRVRQRTAPPTPEWEAWTGPGWETWTPGQWQRADWEWKEAHGEHSEPPWRDPLWDNYRSTQLNRPASPPPRPRSVRPTQRTQGNSGRYGYRPTWGQDSRGARIQREAAEKRARDTRPPPAEEPYTPSSPQDDEVLEEAPPPPSPRAQLVSRVVVQGQRPDRESSVQRNKHFRPSRHPEEVFHTTQGDQSLSVNPTVARFHPHEASHSRTIGDPAELPVRLSGLYYHPPDLSHSPVQIPQAANPFAVNTTLPGVFGGPPTVPVAVPIQPATPLVTVNPWFANQPTQDWGASAASSWQGASRQPPPPPPWAPGSTVAQLIPPKPPPSNYQGRSAQPPPAPAQQARRARTPQNPTWRGKQHPVNSFEPAERRLTIEEWEQGGYVYPEENRGEVISRRETSSGGIGEVRLLPETPKHAQGKPFKAKPKPPPPPVPKDSPRALPARGSIGAFEQAKEEQQQEEGANSAHSWGPKEQGATAGSSRQREQGASAGSPRPQSPAPKAVKSAVAGSAVARQPSAREIGRAHV